MKKLLLITVLVFVKVAVAQKTAYIPLYLQDTTTNDGSQFSWSKTSQSPNFTIIWGNTVGTNPAAYTADTTLAFNPTQILDTLEAIYLAFKNFGFINDSAGTNLALYKIPVVMYGTWGAAGAQSYANGGDADGVVGSFWVHPIAMHGGHVAAHELTHSIQAQTVIDYRNMHGLGPVWDNAGIFWETHANFMRNLIYPSDVTAYGMDVFHVETPGDWKNTYENYEFLMAIMAADGVGMVNRLWRESLSSEYPLQAYKRLKGYSQAQFNDQMYEYARRMATFDFSYNNVGSIFRQRRADDMVNYLPSVQAAYTILQKDSASPIHYWVPVELAPEESAYNIIPLYPDPDSCSVIVRFKGHTELNSHAGWRYGFVTAHADGTVSRYSPTYADGSREIAFSLMPGETAMYMVIMGAPADNITTNATNDTWLGYPKHFRYPYDLSISGAKPEGFQGAANFRAQLKSGGHLHANGGGWVQNSSSVAASAYVAPYAMVLGNATITSNVRVLNTAIIRDATISGNVQVRDNALVTGGIYQDQVVIKGQALAENDTMSNNAQLTMRARVSNYKLSGTIEVGGDVVVYNDTGNCNNGVYYRMTNYYEDNLLECDGRTAMHPDNLDVNNAYSPFSAMQAGLVCKCATLPGCLSVTSVSELTAFADAYSVYPNPSEGPVSFRFADKSMPECELVIYNAIGAAVLSGRLQASGNFSTDLSSLPTGLYTAKISEKGKQDVMMKVIIQR